MVAIILSLGRRLNYAETVDQRSEGRAGLYSSARKDKGGNRQPWESAESYPRPSLVVSPLTISGAAATTFIVRHSRYDVD